MCLLPLKLYSNGVWIVAQEEVKHCSSRTPSYTQAAQTDNHNSETLKAVLAVAVECITQQANTLEILEAEVAEKVSESELKQALGQKLSLREFLGYFQKV